MKRWEFIAGLGDRVAEQRGGAPILTADFAIVEGRAVLAGFEKTSVGPSLHLLHCSITSEAGALLPHRQPVGLKPDR
jgi:hypothetical protein